MSEAKFTSGPWQWVNPSSDEPWNGESYMSAASLRTVEVFGEDKTDVIDGKSYTRFALPMFVLDYCESMGGSEEECSNAHLIAAAPELFEALRDMLDGWKYIRSMHGDLYGVDWDRAQQKAEEAIAKATGV